jgi:opacity protein-like surface antigen
MRALRPASRLLTLCVLSTLLLVSTLSGVAETAEIYVSADLRGSFVSPELGGYLFYPSPGDPPTNPTNPGDPREISGEGDDQSLVIGVALGIAQPLDSWRFLGRSLEGWAVRGELEFDGQREYRVSTAGPLGPTSEVTSHIKARTVLVNFWLDFPIYQKLSGHAGWGVGMTGANLSGGDRGASDLYYGYRKEREFSFQVGFGLEYPVIKYVSVLAGYRYADLGGFEVDLVSGYQTGAERPSGRIEYDLSSHELLVGLRLSFDVIHSPFD